MGKKLNGALTQAFLYKDQSRIAAELTSAGNIAAQFTYLGSNHSPDYMSKGGVLYRFVKDQGGSPRLVVNSATGAVAQAIDYDEFGCVLSDSNPGFQPFGFAGGLYDAATGLVRFGARDYDPVVGRWTSKDQLRFFGGTNLQAYCLNDPNNYVDLDGRNPILIGVGAVMLVGGIGTGMVYIQDIQSRARRATNRLFPDRDSPQNNALRHCVATCILTGEVGGIGAAAMDAREDWQQYFEGHEPESCEVDRFNNGVGRRAAADRKEGASVTSSCTQSCSDALSQGLTR